MVSTRQMSIVNGGGDCGQASFEYSPARCTRNSNHSAAVTSEPQASTSQIVHTNTAPINLLDLPPEIIEKIVGNLNFKNACQLRLVCRAMDRMCGQVLNSTFQRLQTQMLARFQAIKSKMPRRESARRNHHLACESDIIETLHMRLTLLQMSFGKHIERKHCCFFPGDILDEVFNILHYIRVTPKLARPYKVTDELFDLSTMAMEYFKEKIEPDLPEIAYFAASNTGKYLALDSSPLGPEEIKEDRPASDVLDTEDLVEPRPQSNMVLRKRIRKIKQGMKRYNSQLSLLRKDLRSCKRKTAEQQKQISEQQKQLGEQQKQTLEYATRLDEYDKKNEEISRKFSTLLQELNKCKTELQYWRSKSPATPPFCNGCGNAIMPPAEELQALMNQGVLSENLDIEPVSDLVPIAEGNVDSQQHQQQEIVSELEELAVITEVSSSSPAANKKRKLEEPNETPTCAPNKKARRVSKARAKRAKI